MRIKHHSVDLVPTKGPNINLSSKFRRSIGNPVLLLVYKVTKVLAKHERGTRLVITFKEDVQVAITKTRYGFSYDITKENLFVDQCLKELDPDSLTETIQQTLRNLYGVTGRKY
jgi:hypothetical protein